MDKLQKAISTLLSSRREPLLLIQYGRKFGNDVDLFCVLEDIERTQSGNIGIFDFYTLTISDCKILVDFLDISVAEPLLNGSVLINNKHTREILLESLTSTRKDLSAIVSHHISRSVREYLVALSFTNKLKKEPTLYAIEGALVDMSFAYSYYYAAKEYAKGYIPPITMSNLESQFILLKNIRNDIRQYHTKSEISIDKIIMYIMQYETMLISDKTG